MSKSNELRELIELIEKQPARGFAPAPKSLKEVLKDEGDA
jgi:hypothetical protein